MKIPFLLRLPVLWAAGDTPAGPSLNPNPKPDVIERLRKYYPLLLIVAAVMVYRVVKAEEHGNWHVAQACLLTALLLTAITVWCWWQERHKTPDLSVKAEIYRRALEKLLWCVAVGMFAMLSAATRQVYWQHLNVARAIGYGILIAGSAFISGVLAGYLFGLRPTDNSKNSANQPSSPPPQTNLVEIADWLTKIILGAGLVQLTRLPTPIWKFAEAMAKGVVAGTNEEPNPAMALAIMGFFSTCGLLYGYLWTRYEDAVTSYGAGDASAAALVNLWLNGHPAPDDQTRLNMIGAVKNASSTARMRIYLQAEQYRKSATEDINERSLPVFQALVDADFEGVFHRNRGQYALALIGRKKDPNKTSEDWSNALSLLNDAIRIRDLSKEPGWRQYEFARAVCRIKLDPNFNKAPMSDAQPAQSIHDDLDLATDTEVPKATKDLIDKDKVVSAWVNLNPKQAT
ncbi:MAG TPA: hypothetical protein VN948_21055 [Terriglobales bacterium]|nr:hypothetical protein [Terriglobales bacterium]